MEHMCTLHVYSAAHHHMLLHPSGDIVTDDKRQLILALNGRRLLRLSSKRRTQCHLVQWREFPPRLIHLHTFCAFSVVCLIKRWLLHLLFLSEPRLSSEMLAKRTYLNVFIFCLYVIFPGNHARVINPASAKFLIRWSFFGFYYLNILSHCEDRLAVLPSSFVTASIGSCNGSS